AFSRTNAARRAASFPQGMIRILRSAVERLDLEIARRVLRDGGIERPGVELRVLEIDADDEPLGVPVEADPLDRHQGLRVQEAPRRLAGLLHVLAQHA